MKKNYYKIRLSIFMFGFTWVIRLAAVINRDFRERLTQNDYSFIMGSRDDDTFRYFQFIGGRVRSRSSRLPSDFALIWRDNQSGGEVMIDMISGKRKALYNAVINGVLTLEGEGKFVSLFMETMNQMNRLFGPKKKKKGSDKAA